MNNETQGDAVMLTQNTEGDTIAHVADRNTGKIYYFNLNKPKSMSPEKTNK